MGKDAQLRIAYTPDSDDAFYYSALQTGRVRMAGFLPEFHCDTIANLNAAATVGEFEVTAISAVSYPAVADRYAILSVGTSVGRGYGPVLVGRDSLAAEDLNGKRVAVPGIPTTGWFLLRSLFPAAIPVIYPFDEVGEAVRNGEVVAGVMIHEELLFYPQLGLQKIADLGAEWCRLHHLPLPVGLNIARRDLGEKRLQQICQDIRRSLEYGFAHRSETLAEVGQLGRGKSGNCTDTFVAMFANEDSHTLQDDVREALRILMMEVVEAGHADAIPPLDIIEGVPGRRLHRPTATKS